MKLEELRNKLRQAPDPTSPKLERSRDSKRRSCGRCRGPFEEDPQRTDMTRFVLCPPCAVKNIARALRLDPDDVELDK